MRLLERLTRRGPAGADDVEAQMLAAQTLADAGDYTGALAIWKPLAQAGRRDGAEQHRRLLRPWPRGGGRPDAGLPLAARGRRRRERARPTQPGHLLRRGAWRRAGLRRGRQLVPAGRRAGRRRRAGRAQPPALRGRISAAGLRRGATLGRSRRRAGCRFGRSTPRHDLPRRARRAPRPALAAHWWQRAARRASPTRRRCSAPRTISAPGSRAIRSWRWPG